MNFSRKDTYKPQLQEKPPVAGALPFSASAMSLVWALQMPEGLSAACSGYRTTAVACALCTCAIVLPSGWSGALSTGAAVIAAGWSGALSTGAAVIPAG